MVTNYNPISQIPPHSALYPYKFSIDGKQVAQLGVEDPVVLIGFNDVTQIKGLTEKGKVVVLEARGFDCPKNCTEEKFLRYLSHLALVITQTVDRKDYFLTASVRGLGSGGDQSKPAGNPNAKGKNPDNRSLPVRQGVPAQAAAPKLPAQEIYRQLYCAIAIQGESINEIRRLLKQLPCYLPQLQTNHGGNGSELLDCAYAYYKKSKSTSNASQNEQRFKEIIQELVTVRADIDYKPGNFYSVIHRAAYDQEFVLVEFLFNLGANFNPPDREHCMSYLPSGLTLKILQTRPQATNWPQLFKSVLDNSMSRKSGVAVCVYALEQGGQLPPNFWSYAYNCSEVIVHNAIYEPNQQIYTFIRLLLKILENDSQKLTEVKNYLSTEFVFKHLKIIQSDNQEHIGWVKFVCRNILDMKLLTCFDFNEISLEILHILHEELKNQPTFIQLLAKVLDKILVDLSGDIEEKVIAADQLEALKTLLRTVLLNSDTILLLIGEDSYKTTLIQSLVNHITAQLSHLLNKRTILNPETKYFNQETVLNYLNDSLKAWRAEHLQKIKSANAQQDRDRLAQESAANQQKAAEAAKASEAAAHRQAQEAAAQHEERIRLERAQLEELKKTRDYLQYGYKSP